MLHLIGPSPSVEDGVIEHKGGVFYIADMDLKHQNIPILPRQLRPEDELVAMFLDGIEVKQMPVQLANDPDVQGDVLVWPANAVAEVGQELPVGTAILTPVDELWHFVGLVSATLEYSPPTGPSRRFLAFAGLDRLRESWLIPERYPYDVKIIHRSDDITVIKRR